MQSLKSVTLDSFVSPHTWFGSWNRSHACMGAQSLTFLFLQYFQNTFLEFGDTDGFGFDDCQNENDGKSH